MEYNGVLYCLSSIPSSRGVTLLSSSVTELSFFTDGEKRDNSI